MRRLRPGWICAAMIAALALAAIPLLSMPDVTTIPSPSGGIVLRGRVVDSGGKPLAGATVRAWRRADLGPDSGEVRLPPESARGTSDSDGMFDIAAPIRGVYLVRVEPREYGVAQFDGAVAVEGQGPRIRVRCREARTAAGIVVDEQGVPLAGLSVAMGPAFEGPQDEFRLGCVTGVTDALGKFRLAGIAAPSRVSLLLDGAFRLDVFAPSGRHLIRGIGAAVQDQIRVTVRSGASVAGTVLLEPDGSALPGASVGFSVEEATSESAKALVVMDAISGPDGSFRMPEVPPGTPVRAAAVATGVGSWSGRSVLQKDTEGRPLHRVDARIRRGITIVGRVIDGAGKPIAGARVGLLGGRLESPTRDDGRWRIEGVDVPEPVDSVRVPIHLEVDAPGFATDETRTQVPVQANVPEIVHDIVLQRAATIWGTVVDAAGKLVEGARVYCSGSQLGPTRSGIDGTFVVPLAAPGSLWLTAEGEHGRGPFITVEVAEGLGVGGVVLTVDR